MILTRDKGQRMWGGGGSGSAGSGGGGGGVDLSGYATQVWVGENYVSIPFFNRLIQAFNGSTAVDPNDLTTAITNIKAMADLWSAGSVSALGYGSGGGGGASALYQLVDVKPNSSTTPTRVYGLDGTSADIGKVLMMGNDGKWYAGTVQSGGGSVTSVGLSAPTGFTVSGSPVTGSGTLALAFATGFRLFTTEDEQAVQYGVTAYGWGNHANAGYATQQWVTQQGYTSNTGTVTSVAMTVPTGFAVSGSPITASGTLALAFASGYSLPLTADTQKGVTAYGWGDHAQAGYASASDVQTLQGYFTSGVANQAARLSATSKTAWGQTYWTSGGVPANISGNMTDVANITSTGGLLKGFNGIELNTTGGLTTAGGYIDFHYNGSTADYTSRIGEDASGRIRMYADLYLASGKSIRIGDGVISWDSTNNALKVSRMSGTSEVAGDIYATGAVSALGFSSGTPGDAAVNELTVNGDTTMYGEAEVQGTLIINNLASLQDGFSIGVDGDAVFEDSVTSPKFMFDQTHYLYYSNSHLYFKNGSTTVTLV